MSNIAVKQWNYLYAVKTTAAGNTVNYGLVAFDCPYKILNFIVAIYLKIKIKLIGAIWH